MVPGFGQFECRVNDTKLSCFDITALLVPGRNCLAIYNTDPNPASVALSLCLYQLHHIQSFVRSIPFHPNILGFDELSIIDPQDDISILGENTIETCPITLKPPSVPVRGKNCRHKQTFDAAAYLEIASVSGNWTCPCCAVPCLPLDLIRL